MNVSPTLAIAPSRIHQCITVSSVFFSFLFLFVDFRALLNAEQQLFSWVWHPLLSRQKTVSFQLVNDLWWLTTTESLRGVSGLGDFEYFGVMSYAAAENSWSGLKMVMVYIDNLQCKLEFIIWINKLFMSCGTRSRTKQYSITSCDCWQLGRDT